MVRGPGFRIEVKRKYQKEDDARAEKIKDSGIDEKSREEKEKPNSMVENN